MYRIGSITIEKVPSHGMAMVNLKDTFFRNALSSISINHNNLIAIANKTVVPAQYIKSFDGIYGTLILDLKAGGSFEIELYLSESTARAQDNINDCLVPIQNAFVAFDKAFPSSIQFMNGEQIPFRMADGFITDENVVLSLSQNTYRTVFDIANSNKNQKNLISDGEILTVMRVETTFECAESTHLTDVPNGAYDIYLFKKLPLVFIRAMLFPMARDRWNILRFLQLELSDSSFEKYIAKSPQQEGKIAEIGLPNTVSDSLILTKSNGNTFALLSSGNITLEYNLQEKITVYTHSDLTYPNMGLDKTRFALTDNVCLSGWILAGNFKDPILEVEEYNCSLPDKAEISNILPCDITDHLYKNSAIRNLLLAGHYDLVKDIGCNTKTLYQIKSGDLQLTFAKFDEGIELCSVYDIKTATELASFNQPPLFEISLYHIKCKTRAYLFANNGFEECRITIDESRCQMSFSKNKEFPFITVILNGVCCPDQNQITWDISVQNDSDEWSIWEITTAPLGVANCFKHATVVYPKGPGSIIQNAWEGKTHIAGIYPHMLYCMQYMAGYGVTEDGTQRGIYFSSDDPSAARKDLYIDYQEFSKSLNFKFREPVPNMSKPHNSYSSEVKIVWQLFDGDWYDSAIIYKNWVNKNSKWANSSVHKEVTSEWFLNNNVWLNVPVSAMKMSYDDPTELPYDNWADITTEFAEKMGVSTGAHIYNWQIPLFDNDYPHYFPCCNDFLEGLPKVQAAGVKIMPYINGRLWDTRDREIEDYQFTNIALPGVCKDIDGSPHTEIYATIEIDGTPVKDGVMCPSSPIWQEKLKEIILQLFDETGVDGVYVDQTAAAIQILCFDEKHGHALGGGGWWREAQEKIFAEIRSVMPKHGIITTECNADPYINNFDGYLTWHCQYPNQVPVFQTVYGSKIYNFGRNYKNVKDVSACCTLAAQQLVFGEHIGWFGPEIVKEKAFEPIRGYAQLRNKIKEYFNFGEMYRPLKQLDVPTILVNWQWHSIRIELPTVQSAVWGLYEQKKILLVYVNSDISSQAIQVDFDALDYSVQNTNISVTLITSTKDIPLGIFDRHFLYEITLCPYQSVAFEITYKD